MLESSFFPVRSDPGMARLAAAQPVKPRPVFRMMVDPEGRIDGSVPVWNDDAGARARVADALGKAAQEQQDGAPAGALAYADSTGKAQPDAQPFGFGDLIDMVNPLQHIPLISNIYRHLTGDTIKPVSQVIGSAIYGGPLGAASALVNVILKDATGRDISGNLVALAFNEPAPGSRMGMGAPSGLEDLPGAVLGFADLNPSTPRAVSPPPPQPVPRPLKLASFSPFGLY